VTECRPAVIGSGVRGGAAARSGVWSMLPLRPDADHGRPKCGATPSMVVRGRMTVPTTAGCRHVRWRRVLRHGESETAAIPRSARYRRPGLAPEGPRHHRDGYGYCAIPIPANTMSSRNSKMRCLLPASGRHRNPRRRVRRDGDLAVRRALDAWIAAVDADELPDLHSFATGRKHDQRVVLAGLTLEHNSGAIEGNVNRIKIIRRQMYGRVGSSLPRNRAPLPTAPGRAETITKDGPDQP